MPFFLADPPTPTSLWLWVSDRGCLYPPALHHRGGVPLSRLLLVKVTDPMDVWRVGLEAIGTGLFPRACLRPSKVCATSFLRKFQLMAEKVGSWVLILGDLPLPHWVLKKGALPLSPSLGSGAAAGAGRGLPGPHP